MCVCVWRFFKPSGHSTRLEIKGGEIEQPQGPLCGFSVNANFCVNFHFCIENEHMGFAGNTLGSEICG